MISRIEFPGGGTSLTMFPLLLVFRNFGGGCFLDPDILSPGQAFLNEMFLSFSVLFLAFGTGLDPRQAAFYGPRFGPLLVGMAVGALTFVSSGLAPGYSGAQMHPARCFAFGIARRDMTCECDRAGRKSSNSLLFVYCFYLSEANVR